MATLMQQLEETVQFIRSKSQTQTKIGIILGSGLGNLANQIQADLEIPYGEIPHFPVSTVEGHKGRLIFWTTGR